MAEYVEGFAHQSEGCYLASDSCGADGDGTTDRGDTGRAFVPNTSVSGCAEVISDLLVLSLAIALTWGLWQALVMWEAHIQMWILGR